MDLLKKKNPALKNHKILNKTSKNQIELNKSHQVYENYELSSIKIENCADNKSFCIYETYKTDYGCKNIQGISDFFEVSSLKSQIACTESVSVFNIQIIEDFTELCAFDLDKLSLICSCKSVVIFLLSKSNTRFLIYWKSREIRHFLVLKHYKDEFVAEDRKVYQFIADFLANSLSRGELGVYKKYSISPTSNQIDIHLLADIRNYNLLPLAAESGNADVVDILLQIGMDTETPDEGINAQSLAWKGQHSDVSLLLAEANLPYAAGIDVDFLGDNFHKFYKRTTELHEAIKDQNVERVKEIITNNKNLKFFFNLSNVSAAKYALTVRAFEIYEILLIYEIFLAPHEYKQKIFNDLTKLERRSVREIHNKHSKDLPDKHINVLMAHSFVGHNVPDAHQKLQHVYAAYKSLSQDERLNAILKVVAASRKLRIIYDFNMNSVDVADPTASEYTEGLFYISGRIYIGAKQLLCELNQDKAIATIAHELCHFAMNLVYENSAKPYFECDTKSYKEFKKICTNYEKTAEREPIVRVVYDVYQPEVYHAELIVRPPHIIAFYRNQPAKLKEIGNIFPKLFDYYEKKVIPEMLEAIPEIDKRHEQKIEKKYKRKYRHKRNVMLTIVFSIFGIIVILVLAAVLFVQPLTLVGTGNNNTSPDNQLRVKTATYGTTLPDNLPTTVTSVATKLESIKTTTRQQKTTTSAQKTTSRLLQTATTSATTKLQTTTSRSATTKLQTTSTRSATTKLQTTSIRSKTSKLTASTRSHHALTHNNQRPMVQLPTSTVTSFKVTIEAVIDKSTNNLKDNVEIHDFGIKVKHLQNTESIFGSLKEMVPFDDKVHFSKEDSDEDLIAEIIDKIKKVTDSTTKPLVNQEDSKDYVVHFPKN